MPSAGERSETPRVLLVDDEEPLVSSIAEGLRHIGFEVVWTTSPAEAIEHATAGHFDVAGLDLVMPQMWGLDLCQKLMEVDPGVRCMILTGHDSTHHCRRAFQSGAADFITKPVKLVDLAERIHAVRAPNNKYAAFVDTLRRHGLVPKGQGADEILASLLLDPLGMDLNEFKSQLVRHYLQRAIEHCKGNPKKLAELCGCSLATVYRMLDQQSLRLGDVN